MSATQFSKLAGIEPSAKDDQTGAEIKAALEGLSGDDRLDASAVKDLPTGGGTAGLERVLLARDVTITGPENMAGKLFVSDDQAEQALTLQFATAQQVIDFDESHFVIKAGATHPVEVVFETPGAGEVGMRHYGGKVSGSQYVQPGDSWEMHFAGTDTLEVIPDMGRVRVEYQTDHIALRGEGGATDVQAANDTRAGVMTAGQSIALANAAASSLGQRVLAEGTPKHTQHLSLIHI